jgi:hypothetical protein
VSAKPALTHPRKAEESHKSDHEQLGQAHP